MAWNGSDLQDSSHYTKCLSQADVEEVEYAVDYYKSLGLGPDRLSRALFPLSSQLSARLRAISDALHSEHGFSVVSGIDPTKYNDEDNILIFAGLAAHVVDKRSNLRHIFDWSDKSLKAKDALRPPELPIKMSFHTDINAGDILALYSQNLSMSGGEQSVVSFWRVYNDLVNENPEVLRTLAQDWRHEIAWSDHVEVIDRPLMHYYQGKLMFSFAKAFLIGSQWDKRLPGGKQISAAQHHAIRILEAKFEEHRFELPRRQGDIVFINNLSILHARASYIDDAASNQCRHVVSLMLRDSERAWQQPPDIYDYIEARFVRPSARTMQTRDERLKMPLVRRLSPKAHD